LRHLWEEGQQRPHLVLVESWGLARAVTSWARQNWIPVKIMGRKTFYYEFGKRFILSVLRWGYFTFTVIMRAWAAYASQKKDPPKYSFSGKWAIVDNFVHKSSWSIDGTYRDRYLPGLLDFLRTHRFKVLIHPVLHGFKAKNYLSVYRLMRQGREKFIIPEDFLRLCDYISILMFPWRYFIRKIEAHPFRGFDMRAIVWEEKVTTGNTSNLTAALIYRLFLRLGETALRPKVIVNWYENQVIDKALIAGARLVFPETTIIGAQILLNDINQLNETPSQSEVEASVVPHMLLTPSERHCRAIQAFTQEIPCFPAAALRYAHLFEPCTDQEKGAGELMILVLLPFWLEDAVELLSILKSSLEKVSKNAPIWIKCHPDYGPRELIESFGTESWPKQFFIFEGGMPEALRRANLVISRGSSSLVEALTQGIPAVAVGKQTAITPRVTCADEISFLRECFSKEELVLALNKIFHEGERNSKRHIKEGRKIRELFFTPVTPQTMWPYLGITAEAEPAKKRLTS
jgi:hypothetical protein